ncbi:MAG: hypothetical protein LBL51_05755, partial [Synergistaceae bacterium]|jgi:hypothetical protein|nr:hypothetical protein [Synergistaceae bacterium]
VYAFGPRPLSFAPVSEKVALVTARGERVKPVRYDRTLDQPINRIAQGLIFFPKQRDRNFALSVQGMGIRDERIFSFQAPPSEEARAGTEEVVVVELPPAPKSPAENKKPENPPARRQPIKIENPQAALPVPPVPPVSPAPETAPAEPEESMADFVAAMRSGTRSGQSERTGEPKEPEQAGDPGSGEDPKQADSQADAYVSREKTVRTFLDQWASGGQAAMYDMLSASSRKLFSRETFESELRKASDFRSALRDGYTLEWLGAERVKVVAVRRILLIRTLAARTLGVVREESAWKIVW